MTQGHRRLSLLATGLALGSIALAPHQASACSLSPPSCRAPVRLFPESGAPSDLIYFKVLVDDPGELKLRDAEGSAIEASIRTIGGERVFAPNGVVAGRRYLTLEYTTVCQGTPTGEEPLQPSAKSFTFWARAAEATLEITPRIQVEERGYLLPDTPQQQRFLRLAYLAPAGPSRAHLQDTYALIDGEAYFFSSPSDHTASWNSSHVELRTFCTAPDDKVVDTCGATWIHAAGSHEIEIWSTIVGAGTQPHAKLTVDLRCDDTRAGADADAGADAIADAGADAAQDASDDARQDAGADAQAEPVQIEHESDEPERQVEPERDDDEPEPESSCPATAATTAVDRDGDGCTLARSGAAGRAGASRAFACGALLLFALRRRRAQRRV